MVDCQVCICHLLRGVCVCMCVCVCVCVRERERERERDEESERDPDLTTRDPTLSLSILLNDRVNLSKESWNIPPIHLLTLLYL